jgi:hypothetical protein
MARALHACSGGVSPAEGCDDDEWMLMGSGLMLIGVCSVGELRTIVSPGGSSVSWPLELDSSPCISLASTCLEGGMVITVVPEVLDLAAELLTKVATCIPPVSPPCSISLRSGMWWCLHIPTDSHLDIAVAGVNPTARPTPPSSCGSS